MSSITIPVARAVHTARALRRDPNTSRFVSSDPMDHTVSTPLLGEDQWDAVFTGPGANAIYIGVRHRATGEFVPAGRDNVMTRAQYDQWVRQQTNPIGNNNTGNRSPNPRPTRPAGDTGGGPTFTRGGGSPPAQTPPFGGGGPDRVQQLNQRLASGQDNLTTVTGELTTEAQAALVEGLDLSDFTEELVAYLNEDSSLNFLIYDDGLGNITYIDAILLTPQQLSNYAPDGAQAPKNMNFPSAYGYLEAGYPIAREGWRPSDSEPPTKMLNVVNGAVCIGTEGNWQVVTSRKEGDGNVLLTDLTVLDWYVVGSVSSILLPRPDLEIKF